MESKLAEINNRKLFIESSLENLSNLKAGKDTSTEFEELCFEIIEHIFEGNIGFYQKKRQKNDVNGQRDHIPDITGNIISANNKPWHFLYYVFGCYTVIIDAKNYNKDVSSSDLYLVTKYLSNNFKRNVAIICTRNITNTITSREHLQLTSHAILREHGFLVIELNISNFLRALLDNINNHLEELNEPEVATNSAKLEFKYNDIFNAGNNYLKELFDEVLLSAHA